MGKRSRISLSLLSTAMLLLTACQPDDTEIASPKQEPSDMPGDISDAVASMGAEVAALDPAGIPLHVDGNFGRIEVAADGRVMAGAVQSILDQVAPMFRLAASDLHFVRMSIDEAGNRHLRYVQKQGGLDVINGDLIVHVSPKGRVFAANGGARGFAVAPTPSILPETAAETLRGAAQFAGLDLGSARLVYIISSRDFTGHLAWELAARGERDGDPVDDVVYVDAHSREIVDVHPRIHFARNRAIYTANNTQSLPGTLKRSEGGAPDADPDINTGYDYSGDVYDFYKTLFNRDSYDNAGAQLKITVHYSNNYVNAFWNGTQMVYGDGDGTTAAPLVRSLDVMAHELTHAVTERTAGLVYQGESVALNEGSSDILGACAEAWKDGAVSADTWKLGEDIWTPATPGDALRYMNNPTQDGQSKDYYPERYTGFGDNGGVHLNSGIANLAFYLVVSGGSHPRNKTPGVVVPAIGIEKARAVWFSALTQYMTSSTNFAAARGATRSAANALYPGDASVAAAFDKAWDAVGVGGGTTPPPPPPPPPGGDVVLTNNTPLGSQGASTGQQLFYKITVPTGATNLTITTSGGTGDADLYVKKGARPTTSVFDFRSWGSTNAETVSVGAATTAADYYIMLNAYATFSGLTIKAVYTGGSPPPPPPPSGGEQTFPNLGGATGSVKSFTFAVPSNARTVTFTLSGGDPDADLRVSSPGWLEWLFGPQYVSEGPTNSESIAKTAKAGNWSVKVYGYETYSGATLVLKWAP